MSDSALIITAIAAVIAAATPGYLAWRQGRRSHILMNSRLTELLDLTRMAAKAEGRIEGVEEEKNRKANPP